MNTPDEKTTPVVRPFREEAEGFRWTDVPVHAYKDTGTHFRGVTRQVLFGAADALDCQFRYFEVEPGGYTTLERHVHVHAVLILRGAGHVLIGEAVHALQPFDLVHIPSSTWHQFHAEADAPLGFLCLVPCDRDRPQHPTPQDLNTLRSIPLLDDFIR